MAILIEAPTIKNGWERLVKKIIKEGSEIKDERGSKTIELRNTLVSVDNPLKLDIPPGYFWSGEKLEIYAEQFLSNDRKGFVYTYGNRLRKHFQNIGLRIHTVMDEAILLERYRVYRIHWRRA